MLLQHRFVRACRYEVNGFKVSAHYAAPAVKTSLPVILVILEILGVHELIVDTARRFARAGYLAIAPELFALQGDPSQYGEMAKPLTEVVSTVPDAQVITAHSAIAIAIAQHLHALGDDAQHFGAVHALVCRVDCKRALAGVNPAG